MKRLAFAILFLPALAHGGVFAPSLVYTVATTSMTVAGVTVSSLTATKVDAVPLKGRFSLEIQNIDVSNIWCNPNSAAVAINAGRKIIPGATWVVPLGDTLGPILGASNPSNMYCLADGTGSLKAVVTQIH